MLLPPFDDIVIEMARVERECFTRAIERVNARNEGEIFEGLTSPSNDGRLAGFGKTITNG